MLSQCLTTASLAVRFASVRSVRTFPSIFSITLMSWSRALKLTMCPGFQSRRLNRTSTPPPSGCQSYVTGTFVPFQLRARSSLQRNVGPVLSISNR